MRIDRRKFLYGLGLGVGAPLLLPLLRTVRAEELDGTAKRLVIVVEGNGIEPHNFLADAARSALADTGAEIGADERVFTRRYVHESPVLVSGSGLATAKSLGPLTGDGLQDQAAVLLGLSSKISGGGHSTNFGALSSSPSRSSIPASATIDHVVSEIPGVGDAAPFQAVRLGIHGKGARMNYQTCATGPNRPAPIVCDPTAAFNMLFGSVAESGQRTFQDRRDLLDFAAADVNAALQQFSGSSRERAKLERYLESLEELTGQHDRISQMRPILQEAAPPSPDESPLYGSMHPLEHLDVMFQVATSALIGCLTRVVVIASGTGQRGFDVDYTSLDPDTPGRHSVCHANDTPFLTSVTERHVSYVARMARRLREVPEGDGTMLDHTAILYMSDNGEKHHSKAEEWPMLLVGGSALGFQTDGRTVIYPALGEDNHRQVSNVYNTLGHAMGLDLDEFGAEGDKRVAPGPLSELLS